MDFVRSVASCFASARRVNMQVHQAQLAVFDILSRFGSQAAAVHPPLGLRRTLVGFIFPEPGSGGAMCG
jgi:hypothetical protein